MTERSVAVVGAGVAGCVAALRLRQLGQRVLLFGCEDPPAEDEGPLRSLSPAGQACLEQLGLGPAFAAAGFPRPTRVDVAWESSAPRQAPEGGGWLVGLDRLTELLRGAARDVGVEAKGLASVVSEEAGGWTIHAGGGAFHAPYLIAAAPGVLPGPAAEPFGPPTQALWAGWKAPPGGETSIRVDAGPEGWLWLAVLPSGRREAVLLTTPRGDAFPAAWARLRDAGFAEQLPERPDRSRALDASCRVHPAPTGPAHVVVGSAALSLDPLSSQGLQRAMVSALQGATVCHTTLELPGNSCIARRFYRERLAEARRAHRRTSARFYAVGGRRFGTSFWHERAPAPEADIPEPLAPPPLDAHQRLSLAPEAGLELVPTLAGDLIRLEPALVHPRLDGPVAYLGELPIVPILRVVSLGGFTPTSLVRALAPRIPAARLASILAWCWERGILVSPSSASPQRCLSRPGNTPPRSGPGSTPP